MGAGPPPRPRTSSEVTHASFPVSGLARPLPEGFGECSPCRVARFQPHDGGTGTRVRASVRPCASGGADSLGPGARLPEPGVTSTSPTLQHQPLRGVITARRAGPTCRAWLCGSSPHRGERPRGREAWEAHACPAICPASSRACWQQRYKRGWWSAVGSTLRLSPPVFTLVPVVQVMG